MVVEGKIVIIALICLLLAWLPEGYWQRGLVPWKWVRGRVVRRRKKSLLYRGYALQRLMGEGALGKREISSEAPVYKFYTELFLTLIHFARTYGSPLREPLLVLQGHLSKDIQFERRVQGIRRESMAQFILMAAIIWFFTLMASSTFELPRQGRVDGFIAGLQGGGWLCFHFFDGVLKRFFLKWFECVARPLLSFDSLLKTGLSCGEMIRISQVAEALDVLEKSFPEHHLRLEEMLKKWRDWGDPISSEWELFLQEIWTLLEEKCQIYAKYLQVVKFLVLVLFFLSSYFVYLSSLFSGFFE